MTLMQGRGSNSALHPQYENIPVGLFGYRSHLVKKCVCVSTSSNIQQFASQMLLTGLKAIQAIQSPIKEFSSREEGCTRGPVEFRYPLRWSSCVRWCR